MAPVLGEVHLIEAGAGVTMDELFDDIERTDGSPKWHSESTFDFLNRCSRPAIALVRDELSRWFHGYPESERKELRRRFQTELDSSFFELLLHELFRKLGGSIAIHPHAGSKGKQPDFRIELGGGRSFLLEATLVTDSESMSCANGSNAAIYDALNKIDSPDFFLQISHIANPPHHRLVQRKLRTFVDRELAKLNYDAIVSDKEVPQPVPFPPFQDGDAEIEITAVPKRPSARGRKGVRPVGMYPMESHWGNGEEQVRRSLESKSNRYGKLEMPFVVAMNLLSPITITLERSEQRQVLFGSEQECVSATGELYNRRLANGFWGTESQPRCTRVSAVVFCLALPWNIPRIDFCLYRNPWAAHPLPDCVWPFCEATQENGDIRYTEGRRSVAELFDLEPGWPGAIFPDSSS